MNTFDDPATLQKLAEAAEIITRNSTRRWRNARNRAGPGDLLRRRHGHLVQSMQTTLGSAGRAARDMVELLGADGTDGPAN